MIILMVEMQTIHTNAHFKPATMDHTLAVMKSKLLPDRDPEGPQIDDTKIYSFNYVPYRVTTSKHMLVVYSQ